jgi:hypothetical protein
MDPAQKDDRGELNRGLDAWLDAHAAEIQANTDARLLELPPEVLTEKQRERRAFLLQPRREAQAAGARPPRREPASRRPRKAGREETARMAAELPVHARASRTMTNATLRVYRTLWLLADAGRDDPPIGEIAALALCHERAVQLAIGELKKSGHLVVTYRRVRRGMNATNQYRLSFHRGAVSPAAGRGENLCGVKRKKVCSSTSPAADECSSKRSAPPGRASSDPKIAPCRGSARKLRAVPCEAPAPAQRRAGFTEETARLALASLERQGIGHDLGPDDFEGLCRTIEDLRRQHFPDFSPRWWAACVRRLGFLAYMAVLEVLDLAEVKTIHSMTAYLGGILRKPPDDVRPDLTLARIQYSAAA